MPQLPTTLGPAQTPISRYQIPRYDPTIKAQGDSDAAAIQEKGTQNLLQGVGSALGDIQQAQDTQDLATAQAAFLKDKVTQDTTYDSDPDYQTMGPRYQAAVTQSQQTAASMITNPLARKQFLADTNVDVQRGVAQIQSKARAKEVDVGRATLMTQVNDNINAAFSSSDTATREGLLRATGNQIDAAVQKGYIDPSKGAEMKIQTGNMYIAKRQEALSGQYDAEADQLSAQAYQSGDLTAALKAINGLDARYVGSLPTDQLDKKRAAAINRTIGLWVQSDAVTPDKVDRYLKGTAPIDNPPVTTDATPQVVNTIINVGEKGQNGQRSPAGALGVMQVMPDTAREIAGEIGVPYDPVRLQYDEAYNKQIGTAYLGKLLTKYNGDTMLASAAYNAGPGAVDGWIQKFGDPRTSQISHSDWAALIPVNETRGYVGRVVGALAQTTSAPADRQAVVAGVPQPQGSQAVADGLDPTNLPGLLSQTQTRRNRETAQAEAQAKQRQQDVVDIWPAHIKSLQMTGKGVDGFNLEDHAADFSPRQFANLKQQQDDALAANAVIQPISGGTAQEAAAALAKVQPVAGSADFDGQLEVARAAQSAMDARNKGLKDDPAGYLIANDKTAAAAFEALSQHDPRANDAESDAVVQGTLNYYRQREIDMGVAPADTKPLPNQIATNLGQTLMTSAPADVTATIDGIAKSYGQDGLKQVLTTKGVNPGFSYLAFADNPADAVLRSTAVQAMQTKTEDAQTLMKARGKTDQQLETALNGVLDNALYVNMPGGSLATYHDAMMQTMRILVGQGMDETAAAEQVYAPFQRAYNFTDTLMIPKTYDQGQVQSGLDGALSHLDKFDINTLGGAAAALPPGYTREQMNQALKTQGVWVTSPDDQSAILTINVGEGMVGPPVMLNNGQRLEVKFSDAQQNVWGAAVAPGHRSAGPIQPTQPKAPGAPQQPGAPTQPAKPERPPRTPTQPAKPAAPSAPVKPERPILPDAHKGEPSWSDSFGKIGTFFESPDTLKKNAAAGDKDAAEELKQRGIK